MVRPGPRRIGLCVLALVVGSGPARAVDPARPALPGPDAAQAAAPAPTSALRDEAGMFSPEARARLQQALARVEQRHHVPIRIEAVASLEGEEVAEAAARRARESGQKGIYILVARKETKLQIVSRDLRDRVGQEVVDSIRNTLIEGFRRGDFEAGLARAVQEIDDALARTTVATRPAPASALAPGATGSADAAALVARNQARLTLAGARRVVAGAEAKAAALGLKVNVMVVDDGGHPLAFARMDGARPASAYTATTKAITAATFRQATGPIPAGTSTPDPLLNLSLQNAAAAGGGKLTTLLGGEPIVVDEQVIGGVGVGGGSGEQDAEVARAGVAAFLEGLRGPTSTEPTGANDAP
jgi:glc operon protein GlcG